MAQPGPLNLWRRPLPGLHPTTSLDHILKMNQIGLSPGPTLKRHPRFGIFRCWSRDIRQVINRNTPHLFLVICMVHVVAHELLALSYSFNAFLWFFQLLIWLVRGGIQVHPQIEDPAVGGVRLGLLRPLELFSVFLLFYFELGFERLLVGEGVGLIWVLMLFLESVAHWTKGICALVVDLLMLRHVHFRR